MPDVTAAGKPAAARACHAAAPTVQSEAPVSPAGSSSSIGLWGRSMGAVTALLYCQQDPSVAGMVRAPRPAEQLGRQTGCCGRPARCSACLGHAPLVIMKWPLLALHRRAWPSPLPGCATVSPLWAGAGLALLAACGPDAGAGQRPAAQDPQTPDKGGRQRGMRACRRCAAPCPTSCPRSIACALAERWAARCRRGTVCAPSATRMVAPWTSHGQQSCPRG